MNTLAFDYDECINVQNIVPRIDQYVRDAGDVVAASRYLDYFLFYVAAEMITTVWCRRGEGFVVNHTPYYRKALMLARQRMQHIPAIEMHGIDAMFRYNFLDLFSDNRNMLKFSRLFTLQQQWYERDVVPSGKTLEEFLPDLVVCLVSPHQPERFCTFKPWALYTGTGVVEFNNV